MQRAPYAVGMRRHNDNDITMKIAGLWRYGDWRHVATGCTALMYIKRHIKILRRILLLPVITMLVLTCNTARASQLRGKSTQSPNAEQHIASLNLGKWPNLHEVPDHAAIIRLLQVRGQDKQTYSSNATAILLLPCVHGMHKMTSNCRFTCTNTEKNIPKQD